MSGSARRLLVTLAIPALFLSAQHYLLLPGVTLGFLQQIYRRSGAGRVWWPDWSTFSVVAIGLAPALAAFLIVEFAALLVPPWRILRRGSPEQRRALDRAALVLTLLLALVQAWLLARYLTDLRPSAILRPYPDTTGTRVLLTASLVGGTAFALALAALVRRFGLGNGFSLLMVAALVPAAVNRVPTLTVLPARDLLWLAVELGALIYATRFILGAGRGAAEPGPLRFRRPTSGLGPISCWPSLTALLTLREIPVPAERTPLYWLAFVVTTLAGVLVLSRLYHPPATLTAYWRRLIPDEANPTLAVERAAAFKRAVAETLAFLVAVAVVLPELTRQRPLADPIEWIWVVIATAVALDFVAEWRARAAHGELVAVWPLHQLALLDVALTALARADIPVHARAANHRALLWFFGPFLPVELMVPAGRATEARERLAAALTPPSTTSI